MAARPALPVMDSAPAAVPMSAAIRWVPALPADRDVMTMCTLFWPRIEAPAALITEASGAGRCCAADSAGTGSFQLLSTSSRLTRGLAGPLMWVTAYQYSSPARRTADGTD